MSPNDNATWRVASGLVGGPSVQKRPFEKVDASYPTEWALLSSFEPTPLPEGIFFLAPVVDLKKRAGQATSNDIRPIDNVSALLREALITSDLLDGENERYYDSIFDDPISEDDEQNEESFAAADLVSSSTFFDMVPSDHRPQEQSGFERSEAKVNIQTEQKPSSQTPRSVRKTCQVPSDKRWMDRYNELVAFHRRFGHTCVPSQWHENPPLAQVSKGSS